MTRIESNTVVIGAGIAGMVAALRLSELGIEVLVLEQGSEERYACNTRMAGGAFHVAHQDVLDEPEPILQAINKRTRGSARPGMAETLARNIAETTRWLQKKGVRFIKVGHEPYRRHTLAPPIRVHGRNYWEGRGGDVLLRTLAGELEKKGGQVLRGIRAVRLTMQGAVCVGLEAERGTEKLDVRAQSVVICDGGFHSNMDLLREFISLAPEKLKQRNAQTGHGDGLRMAREIGAQLVGLNRFYGHVLAQEALHNDDLWPFPMMDFVCSAGIVVDKSARRFMDEGLGGVTMANAIAARSDPLCATVIFDAEIWNGAGREYLIPANPTLVSAGGTLYAASSLRGLAEQLDLPASELESTVAEYNAAVAAGRTSILAPRRSTGAYEARQIGTPPYHAVRLCTGITYTMGGIAIDSHGRVLDMEDKPIAGLYAAGCATGGLEGGDQDQVAYIGGLTRSAVFGLRAADDIASRR